MQTLIKNGDIVAATEACTDVPDSISGGTENGSPLMLFRLEED